jgi:thiamine-monophosphate kinase
MDLSDGLGDALHQVADASGVGVVVTAAALPIADEVRETLRMLKREALSAAISAGDDYELLFTSRPSQRGRLRAVRQQVGDLPITRIGVVTKSRDVVLRDEQGTREMPRGYEHWRRSAIESSIPNHQ